MTKKKNKNKKKEENKDPREWLWGYFMVQIHFYFEG